MAKLVHKITQVQYHRNGSGGNGFDVVLFKMRDGRRFRNMVATVFEQPGSVAVLDVDQTARGEIGKNHNNQWRGDEFEAELREAISSATEEQRFQYLGVSQ